MIRAVVDPGVLIAGTISSLGAPAAIIRAWLNGAVELVVCPGLLGELGRAFAYPKVRDRVAPADADRLLTVLETTALMLPDPVDIPSVCRDPNDDYLFALAAATSAVLVSGDGDVLAVEDAPIRVLTPAAFTTLTRDPRSA